MRRFFLFGLALVIAHAVGLAASLFIPRGDASAEGVSAIIVLGAGLNPDGSLGLRSRARTEAALHYWQNTGGTLPLVFTGGGTPAVGQAMAEAAQRAGVPRSLILVEDQSWSTMQNALFSRPLVDHRRPVVLATNPVHMPRSRVTFRLMGYAETRPVTAERQATPGYFAREIAATWFNLARFPLWLIGDRIGGQADWLLE